MVCPTDTTNKEGYVRMKRSQPLSRPHIDLPLANTDIVLRIQHVVVDRSEAGQMECLLQLANESN